MTVQVWEEFLDGKSNGWTCLFKPLNLLSQGATREEAIVAMRECVLSWANYATEEDRITVLDEPPHCWLRNGIFVERIDQ
jgi:hypothetical protein